MFQMDPPGVQQQSAQSDYSINNNEPNEANCNASDRETDLTFIKKKNEGHVTDVKDLKSHERCHSWKANSAAYSIV